MGTFLKQPRKAAKGPSKPKPQPVAEPVKVVLTGPDTGHMGSPSMQRERF